MGKGLKKVSIQRVDSLLLFSAWLSPVWLTKFPHGYHLRNQLIRSIINQNNSAVLPDIIEHNVSANRWNATPLMWECPCNLQRTTTPRILTSAWKNKMNLFNGHEIRGARFLEMATVLVFRYSLECAFLAIGTTI